LPFQLGLFFAGGDVEFQGLPIDNHGVHQKVEVVRAGTLDRDLQVVGAGAGRLGDYGGEQFGVNDLVEVWFVLFVFA
jgi:hypothetical protein